MLRTNEGKLNGFSDKKNPICDHALDRNKCLKLIKLQTLLLSCAPISKLPSSTSTMVGLVLGVPRPPALKFPVYGISKNRKR